MNSNKEKYKRLIVTILCGFLSVLSAFGAAVDCDVTSPNGRHRITFTLSEGKLYYSVSSQGDVILMDSQLSLSLDGEDLDDDFEIIGSSENSHDSSWAPVAGSRAYYPDVFKECVVHLKESTGQERKLDLVFRAYDEGVAFRYVIPKQSRLAAFTINAENSEFQFVGNHFVYWDDYPQAKYSRVRLSEMGDNSVRPLLVETESRFVAIAEAGSLERYAPMKLNRSGENRLVTRFRHGRVDAVSEIATPWRVVMIADNPGALVERHYLLQNLSEPCALEDTSWIQAGKVWRSSLDSAGAKAIIDYCAANDYQYVHYDAGWYGPERDADSNPVTYIDDIDMPEVIRYASQRGIGLICYINRIAMSRYELENTFRTYSEWGIRGVKFGFVDWQSQADMEFLYNAIRTAAKYELIVNIHDNFRLTGIERTYPHVLTVEGILGNEERADRGNPPKNVLTTSFARMIAGAGDYTPCFLNGRVVSRSFQLALGVVFYSPLQYLHWYDQAHLYEGEVFPELEFWKAMPTTWDDSRTLHGKIGDYMTVARRKGESWFVGTIVDDEIDLDIPLDFLGDGIYTAKVYREDRDRKRDVVVESLTVTSESVVSASMGSGSGHAIWIYPLADRRHSLLKESADEDDAADFYVSPNGSDHWSGTLPEENETDGPFATLARARDAVRELKKSHVGDIVVQIRGGRYRLSETVVFGKGDSGEGESSVTYSAYPGEAPVFSSAREIEGWQLATGELPGLPKEARGNVWMADVSGQFFTLYDSEGMLPRARSEGFIPLPGGSRNRLHFPEGKLKNWSNVEDVEIIVRPHHAWIVNVLPLASVDEKAQIVETSIDATYAMNPLHFLKTTDSCWVENVLEALDEPGEWALNTQEGKLYLWPRGETRPRGILAPTLKEYILVEGRVDKTGPKDDPVRNLIFRGLTFMHGDRYSVAEDDAGLQHDWDMHDKANALVRLRGAENCVIDQCHFVHSGGGAIRVDLHGQRHKITGNHIERMGGAGILLCGYGPGAKDVNRENLVYNNHIHHTGRIYSSSPGIMIWQSGENRVANNLVHHTPYTGIIVSGCVTHFFTRNGREVSRTIRRHEIGDLPEQPTLEDVRPYLHTHDNRIEYNEIHHAMEELGDGNAIYIRGAGAGNVIRHNYVHHLVAPMIMQAAIRTDGGQRDTLISENLIYKCVSQGILMKLNTRVENNIVADIIAPPRGYYLSLREGPMEGAVIQRNILYSTGRYTEFINELPPGNGRTTEDRRGRALARATDANMDCNIYYSSVEPELGKSTLEKQRSDGVDANSLAVDPMFVDPENGDFSFKPDSPALELGIVPFDMSKVGLRLEHSQSELQNKNENEN